MLRLLQGLLSLLFFSLIFSISVSANDSLISFFESENAEFDLNNDGEIDFQKKSELNKNIETLVFTPSWDPTFKIEIDKGYLFSERRIYLNQTLNELIRFENKTAKVKTVFSAYTNGVFTKKTIHKVASNTSRLIITSYILKNNKWNLKNENMRDLKTSHSEHSDATKCDEYFEPNILAPTPLPNVKPLLRKTEGDYAYSKIGFKIDKKTCPKQAIEEIGKAINEMRTKYIPCLKGYRPNLTAVLLMDLWEYESEIKCFPKKDGVAADTRTYVGAGINIYGLTNTGYFSSANLANTLLHEVLHHHLDSCKYHSTDIDKDDSIKDKTIRYDDGVYGCTEMCEYDLYQNQNRLTVKGCQRCLTDDFSSSYFWKDILNQDTISRRDAKKQCNKHPRVRRIKLCQKFTGKKDCPKYRRSGVIHL